MCVMMWTIQYALYTIQDTAKRKKRREHDVYSAAGRSVNVRCTHAWESTLGWNDSSGYIKPSAIGQMDIHM